MSHITIETLPPRNSAMHRAVKIGLLLGVVGAIALAPEAAYAAPFGNPDPVAPPGAQSLADEIMGWVKWGALGVIIGAGFIGAGAIAGGHFFSHQRSSQVGVRILTGAIIAAVIYAIIYGIIVSIAK